MVNAGTVVIAVLGLCMQVMVSAGPVPIAHGAYSVDGVGIRGPPAATYTIRLNGSGGGVMAHVQVPTTTTTGTAAASPIAAMVNTFISKINGMTGRRARQMALAVENKQDTLARIAKVYGPGATATPTSSPTLTSTGSTQSSKPIPTSTTTTSGSGSVFAPAPKQDEDVGVEQGILKVISNQAGYSPSSVKRDLHVARKWAEDLHQLKSAALLNETVAAILSAATRYYPEVSARAAARAIIADIKAESDFQPDLISGARLDSGSSWGLMQVSPLGASRELDLFKKHASIDKPLYSWGDAPDLGPLLDWKTGKPINLASLTNQDLFRPWINIHVASWIQSNLARSSSQDPSTWIKIAEASANADDKVESLLKGANLPRTVMTGFGSWVAGPSVNDNTGYARSRDDISKQYLRNIGKTLNVLYGTTLPSNWLDSLELTPGLIDFRM